MASIGIYATSLGRARWIEQRLFEVMGGWVASTDEPEVKVRFAEDCYHHAWHAQVWADRFPAGYDLDLEDLTRPPPGWDAALDALAALETTMERLAGVVRLVLPRKIAAYRRWSAVADGVSEASLPRWLDLVVRDELRDWQTGEALLERSLVSTDLVDSAHRAVRELEVNLWQQPWAGLVADPSGPAPAPGGSS